MTTRVLPACLVFAWAVCVPQAIMAAEYYVDARNGDDVAPGTSPQQAWKTLERVKKAALKAGDSMLFKRGEAWQEKLVIVGKNGTQPSPIVFQAYGKGKSPSVRGVHITRSKHVVLKNLMVENSPKAGITICEPKLSHITVDHCVVRKSAGTGITVWTPDEKSGVAITNSVIQDNGSENKWSSGIFIKARNAIIAGNKIRNNGYGDKQRGYSHGIYVDTGAIDVRIHDNEICRNKRGHGVQVKGSATIYRNVIRDNGIGGVYFGENGKNNVKGSVYLNIFGGNKQGIVQYSKGRGDMSLEIYNNSFYHNVVGDRWTAEIWITDNLTSLSIKNNVIHAGRAGCAYSFEPAQSNASIDYNCVFRSGPGVLVKYGGKRLTWTGWRDLGFDSHGINADPRYVQPSKNDLRIRPDSPVIDVGCDVGLRKDFVGNPIPAGKQPDIGAYEYAPTSNR